MARIRIKGIKTGENIGTVSSTVGGESGSTEVASFQKPPVFTGVPRVSDGFSTDMFSVDTTDLTGITAYQWRILGGGNLGTAATQMGMAAMGQWITCEVTCDQGILTSPPVMVYMPMAMASHNTDDANIVAVVPHRQATHIAVASGDWSDPAIWLPAEVPQNGAFALIPRGQVVTYNVDEPNIRLDRVRVDGTLTWAVDRSTYMLAESIIGTRGSEILMGTKAAPLPASHRADIRISGKDYSSDSYMPTDINLAADPGLWGRGVVSQGVWRIWGGNKAAWSFVDPLTAGATSATLHKTPEGWQVGDEIVISGTKVTENGINQPMTLEDEIRTITAISGMTVSWSQGLVYTHANQHPTVARDDLFPIIMLRRSRNICIQSEVTSPVWRRGHTSSVHGMCTADYWNAEFINLGRTDKASLLGKVDENGDFKYQDNQNTTPDNILTEPLTAQSNIAARYPVHMHHVGFEHPEDARPIVKRCYVEGTPGWGMVHHSCDVDFFENGIFDFWGAGMVAESGNELGAWVDNACGHTLVTNPTKTLSGNPKIREDFDGLSGNNFKYGYAFAFRGRAVRANRNVAFSHTHGHVFYHRNLGNNAAQLFPTFNPRREHIDISETAEMWQETTAALGEFTFIRYPIIHFADNFSIGGLTGMFITKQNPNQQHDVNIKLKRFKAWGYSNIGAEIEYIGTYILDGFDCVPANTNNSIGIMHPPNTYQVAIVNSRVEGNATGIWLEGASTGGFSELFDGVNDPRWMLIGNDFVNVDTEVNYVSNAAKSFAEVAMRDDDLDGTRVDYDMDPSDTFPVVVGEWNGLTNKSDRGSLTSRISNADGRKVSNLNATSSIAPKIWSDEFIGDTEFSVRALKDLKGFWQYGGGAVVVQREIISDPITGRPAKICKLYTCANQPTNGTNNGVLSLASTPVTQTDKAVGVAENGTVTLNVVAGATGGDGSTYALDMGDYIAPDYGRVIRQPGTGEITYTPDRDYIGTDEMYVFVKSGEQFATVRVTFLIGPGGSLTTPLAGTHFAVSDATAPATMDVVLNAPPATGGRRIDLVQYSTDGGASWRRLCNGWVRTTHKVTTQSNGTAISPGGQTLRLRYKTNYDFATSTASGAAAVTIS